MAILRQKINAERKLRELLESAELPMPDEIEYGHTCIRAIWWDRKRAVVIDLDDFAEADDGEAAEAEGAPIVRQAGHLDETLDLDEVVDLGDERFGERYPRAA